MYLNEIHFTPYATKWTPHLSTVTGTYLSTRKMKRSNEEWENTGKEATAQLGKTRDVGTMIGFKREFGIPPMSRWANRFIIAAIIQGALAAGLTAWLLAISEAWLPGYATSKVVAGGGAGTWLFVGYLVYILLGPIAVAVTALFYQHLETNLNMVYSGWTRLLAWGHIVLMNVGVVGATFLMMWAGYFGGALNASLLAKGLTPGAASGQVHTQIMQYYPPYIAVFIGLALLGALAGGLGYVIVWRRSLKTPVGPLKQP